MFLPTVLLSTVIIFSSSPSTVLAQSCWRDVVCTGPTEQAFPGPWDENIYAPSSRHIQPANILCLEDGGSLISEYFSNAIPPLQGNGSALVFDFGKEVGGIVTVVYTTTGGAGALGLAFTEAKDYIGLRSDSSNGHFAGGNVDQSVSSSIGNAHTLRRGSSSLGDASLGRAELPLEARHCWMKVRI